jgi:hypothetical protein
MTSDDGRKPEGAPERSPKAGAAPSGVDGNDPKRFSVQRKMAIVARLLRGEPLELVARETNVSIARLTEWRERALAGAATALKERERDDSATIGSQEVGLGHFEEPDGGPPTSPAQYIGMENGEAHHEHGAAAWPLAARATQRARAPLRGFRRENHSQQLLNREPRRSVQRARVGSRSPSAASLRSSCAMIDLLACVC